jgi:nuclear autoantigenic sperm protein
MYSLYYVSKTEDEEMEEEEGENKENGHASENKEQEASDEAGPSNPKQDENESSNDAENDAEAEDDGGNLEVAWEVLQNAALIFARQEEKGLPNLVDTYIEMANISLENGNYETAVDDFNRALSTYNCLEGEAKNERIAAEIHYKIGLCQSMMKLYDESVKSFQQASDFISGVIAKEKSREEQTDDILAKIKDLEETQQEISNKITEIGETKTEDIEKIKNEFAKLYGATINGQAASNDGASTSGASSSQTKSPETEKAKPTDISHLIKRKKPDSEVDDCSPAKKQIIETSPGEKVAVPSETETKQEKIEEESGHVTESTPVTIDN